MWTRKFSVLVENIYSDIKNVHQQAFGKALIERRKLKTFLLTPACRKLEFFFFLGQDIIIVDDYERKINIKILHVDGLPRKSGGKSFLRLLKIHRQSKHFDENYFRKIFVSSRATSCVLRREGGMRKKRDESILNAERAGNYFNT